MVQMDIILTLQTTWASSMQAGRAVGQVNLADSTSNEWEITGIQLEVNDSGSTDFEHENYGTTLAKCQRYFYKENCQPRWLSLVVCYSVRS